MKIVVVSVEPLWPTNHGGRIRTAGVVQRLASEGHDVTVVAPRVGHYCEPPAGITQELVDFRPPGRISNLAARLRPTPRLGWYWTAGLQTRLADILHRHQPDVVVWSHSYLAAFAPEGPWRHVIDLANVETERFISQMAAVSGGRRLVRWWEAAKARRWEPRVLAAADLVLALSNDDAQTARSWGARVVECRNGAENIDVGPPNRDPVAVMVASFGYEPNRRAAAFLVEAVWPQVRARIPHARLLLVGRQADTLTYHGVEGVTVHADVDDVSDFYRQAAVVCCPVKDGAGRQLKVLEAFAYGRPVIATTYSAQSGPDSATESLGVADDPQAYADMVVAALLDPDTTARRAATARAPSWEDTTAEAMRHISELATSNDSRGTIHLLEVGGRGGVYQHTVAVADALTAAGVDVVLHTADDAEFYAPTFRTCRCFHWYRKLPHRARQVATAAGFLITTVPHMVRVARRNDVVHVQGTIHQFLIAALFAVSRITGVATAFSPHNTFVRRGGPLSRRALRFNLQQAGSVLVFSRSDVDRVSQLVGRTAHLATLTLHTPPPDPADVQRWKAVYGPGPVAVLAGQVRADKRPDVFVAACAHAQVTAAVVGPRHDGEALLEAACRQHGDVTVVRVDEFLELEQFTAAVAAADVVVASHAIGSVSGPLAFAHELGVRSVAFDVGGLGEHVTVAVPPRRGAEGLSTGITSALAGPAPACTVTDTTYIEHRPAYRESGW